MKLKILRLQALSEHLLKYLNRRLLICASNNEHEGPIERDIVGELVTIELAN